jgi:hypothetical protein
MFLNADLKFIPANPARARRTIALLRGEGLRRTARFRVALRLFLAMGCIPFVATGRLLRFAGLVFRLAVRRLVAVRRWVVFFRRRLRRGLRSKIPLPIVIPGSLPQ